MRAIIIDAKHRTITVTDIDGSVKSLQQIVGGLIEPVTQGLDEFDHCYVNEEGLHDQRSISSCSTAATNPSPAMASSFHRPMTAMKRPAPFCSIGSQSA
jgi:Domain of unknown function (DUF3846)